MTQPPVGLADARLTPLPEPTPAWRSGHDVQFYDSEEFLVIAVGKFLREGLRAGQPLVIIATEAHRRGFLEELARHPELRVEGADITWLDARQTLAAFMDGRRPDPELFDATLGRVFEKVMAKRSYLVVRAYGEMVDLLWKDGNTEGAIDVEKLWNALAAKYSFNLLCAYAMNNFVMESQSDGFACICGCHGIVIPTEEYVNATDAERLRQIALLQQRSRVLATELRQRDGAQ